MPKTKSKKEESSDSDSGPEDRTPAKKGKKEAEDNGEDSWTIGKNRFVKLREFKGKWMLDIREFYEADGVLKPGKKGISLKMEEWNKFVNVIDDIKDRIKKRI